MRISYHTMIIPCTAAQSQRYIILFFLCYSLYTGIFGTTGYRCCHRTSIMLGVTPQTCTQLIIRYESIHIITVHRCIHCYICISITADSCIRRHCCAFEVGTFLGTSYRNQTLIRNLNCLDRITGYAVFQIVLDICDVKCQCILFSNKFSSDHCIYAVTFNCHHIGCFISFECCFYICIIQLDISVVNSDCVDLF